MLSCIPVCCTGLLFAYLSRRLKWAIDITICPASIRPSVRLSVCSSVRLLTFKRILLKNHLANFNQTWWETCMGQGIQLCSNKGAGPFWGPLRGKIRKILINLKKSSYDPMTGMNWYLAWIILRARRFKFVQMKSLGSQLATLYGPYIFLYRFI